MIMRAQRGAGAKLTVAECRDLLGEMAANVDDAAVESLRNSVYAIARACCDVRLKARRRARR